MNIGKLDPSGVHLTSRRRISPIEGGQQEALRDRGVAYTRNPLDQPVAASVSLDKVAPDPLITPDDFLDDVHFTLTGQTLLGRGQVHELRFWVHVEEQLAVVLARASLAHGVPISELSVKSEGPYALKKGTRLSVRIRIKGLRCADAHKCVGWTGQIGSVCFLIEAPRDASEGTYGGAASIALNDCEIAKMSFAVRVGESNQTLCQIPSRTTLHRNAFASYASEDRAEVLARVQGISATRNAPRVFVDVIHLRAGQNWERELMEQIVHSDVFYLFWCRHAIQSNWVNKEWRIALELKGEDFIDPVPLEKPELAPPPQELASKHFNSPLLAFIEAAGGRHS